MGSGLGLALVRHIAQIHGGEVALESELGHGSTFSFSLPVSIDRERAADEPRRRSITQTAQTETLTAS